MHKTRSLAVFVATFFSVSMIADANIYNPEPTQGSKNYRDALPGAEAAWQLQVKEARKPLPALFGPEEMLLSVYEALRDGSLNEAIIRADALVEKYPKFALGHFIHGDLQLMRSAPVTEFGTAAQGNEKSIADLREEAAVRIAAVAQRPNPSLVPKSILQLAADQKYAIVVDTSRARLFLYEHVNGHLELIKDLYISQGKNGANKVLQGDNKTPIGVYEITKRYTANQLSDFYGAGALPINYPNAWDTAQERTGYGIWLHGVPPGVHSRPPKSSAGCVVLTNADMEELSKLVDIGKTPVVIVDHEEFISEYEQARLRVEALTLLEQWKADAKTVAATSLQHHYSSDFKATGGAALADWLQRAHGDTDAGVLTDISDVQAFVYPGQSDMLTISFTRTVAGSPVETASHIEQYWRREGDKWRIISETKTENVQPRA